MHRHAGVDIYRNVRCKWQWERYKNILFSLYFYFYWHSPIFCGLVPFYISILHSSSIINWRKVTQCALKLLKDSIYNLWWIGSNKMKCIVHLSNVESVIYKRIPVCSRLGWLLSSLKILPPASYFENYPHCAKWWCRIIILMESFLLKIT